MKTSNQQTFTSRQLALGLLSPVMDHLGPMLSTNGGTAQCKKVQRWCQDPWGLAKWCKVIYKYPAIKGKHAGYKPMISVIVIYYPNGCSIGVPISWQILRQEQKQQHNSTKSYNGKSQKHTLENKSKCTIIFLKPGFAMLNQWVGTICVYTYIYILIM